MKLDEPNMAELITKIYQDGIANSLTPVQAIRDAIEGFRLEVSKWLLPWGTLVRKKPGIMAGYSGPGRFRGYAIAEDGSYRFTIGHRIEGGAGELLHHYMPNQIEIEPEPMTRMSIPTLTTILKGEADNGNVPTEA